MCMKKSELIYVLFFMSAILGGFLLACTRPESDHRRASKMPVCLVADSLEFCFMAFVDLEKIKNERNATYIEKIGLEEPPGRKRAVLVKLLNRGHARVYFGRVDSLLWANAYSLKPAPGAPSEYRHYDYQPKYHQYARGDTLMPNGEVYVYLPMAEADTFSLTMGFDFAWERSFAEKYINAMFYRRDSSKQDFVIEME
jgi:hypothetical protein